jgi:hypothetical protein
MPSQGARRGSGGRGRDSGYPLPAHRPVPALLAASAHGSHLGDRHAQAMTACTCSLQHCSAPVLWHCVQHRPMPGNLLGRPPSLHPLRPGSQISPVLCGRATPRRRARRTYGASPSPPGPSALRPRAATSSRFRAGSFSACLGSSTPQDGCVLASTGRSLVACWGPDTMGVLERPLSELYTQPTDTPVQRFPCDVTAALTWLGARVVRYTFPV